VDGLTDWGLNCVVMGKWLVLAQDWEERSCWDGGAESVSRFCIYYWFP